MESAAVGSDLHQKIHPLRLPARFPIDMNTPLSFPRWFPFWHSGSQVSWWRVLSALLRRPSLLKEFLRLERGTRKASDQLGKGLGELLTLTLDWFGG